MELQLALSARTRGEQCRISVQGADEAVDAVELSSFMLYRLRLRGAGSACREDDQEGLREGESHLFPPTGRSLHATTGESDAGVGSTPASWARALLQDC